MATNGDYATVHDKSRHMAANSYNATGQKACCHNESIICVNGGLSGIMSRVGGSSGPTGVGESGSVGEDPAPETSIQTRLLVVRHDKSRHVAAND